MVQFDNEAEGSHDIFLPAGNYRNGNGRTEGGKSGRNAASRAAPIDSELVWNISQRQPTEVKIKSGLIDEAFVCQTFHLENKDKIRLERRGRNFTPPQSENYFLN